MNSNNSTNGTNNNNTSSNGGLSMARSARMSSTLPSFVATTTNAVGNQQQNTPTLFMGIMGQNNTGSNANTSSLSSTTTSTRSSRISFPTNGFGASGMNIPTRMNTFSSTTNGTNGTNLMAQNTMSRQQQQQQSLQQQQQPMRYMSSVPATSMINSSINASSSSPILNLPIPSATLSSPALSTEDVFMQDSSVNQNQDSTQAWTGFGGDQTSTFTNGASFSESSSSPKKLIQFTPEQMQDEIEMLREDVEQMKQVIRKLTQNNYTKSNGTLF